MPSSPVGDDEWYDFKRIFYVLLHPRSYQYYMSAIPLLLLIRTTTHNSLSGLLAQKWPILS